MEFKKDKSKTYYFDEKENVFYLTERRGTPGEIVLSTEFSGKSLFQLSTDDGAKSTANSKLRLGPVS